MALQKFAHGATYYCKFKHSALCENALALRQQNHHQQENFV